MVFRYCVLILVLIAGSLTRAQGQTITELQKAIQVGHQDGTFGAEEILRVVELAQAMPPEEVARAFTTTAGWQYESMSSVWNKLDDTHRGAILTHMLTEGAVNLIPSLDHGKLGEVFGHGYGYTPREWAALWTMLEIDSRGAIITHMPMERAANLIPSLDHGKLGQVFGEGYGYTPREWAKLWAMLERDDRGAVITHMPMERAASLILHLDPAKLGQVFGRGFGYTLQEWAKLWDCMPQQARDGLSAYIERGLLAQLDGASRGTPGTIIEVNVYKIKGIAPLWHTGTVFDEDGERREYYFNSHNKVAWTAPRHMNGMSHHRTMVRVVPYSAVEVLVIRNEVCRRFHNSRYDLATRNCNIFTHCLLLSLGVSGLDEEYLKASGLAEELGKIPGVAFLNEVLVKWPVKDKRIGEATIKDLEKLDSLPRTPDDVERHINKRKKQLDDLEKRGRDTFGKW